MVASLAALRRGEGEEEEGFGGEMIA